MKLVRNCLTSLEKKIDIKQEVAEDVKKKILKIVKEEEDKR